MRFDAVVLAGGRASRLGGIDKTALGPAGDTLLDRALRAVAGADRRTVVGGAEAHRSMPGVRWTAESPPFGGPVAAIAAGLALPGRGAPWTILLASDLPNVEAALPRLLEALDESAQATIAVDPDGRDQPLLGVYRTAALATGLARLPDGGAGVPMRRLLADLAVHRVLLAADLVQDVDTPDDARRSGLGPA